ncbi:MAG: homocysteine S-methyltransferase family protein [Candidatus Limnocylindrales bacterium]
MSAALSAVPNPFLALLAHRTPIVADGPMGTRLAELGLPAGDAPERWVLEPAGQAAVRSVHRAYREAGAQILLTNTFGANPTRLALHSLAGHLDEINRTGAQLARRESGSGMVVAGSMGPTGEFLAPLGTLPFEKAVEGFTRQAAALAAGGVDVLWIETMTDLEEARAAIEGARQGAPGLPVVATLAFGAGGATLMGVRPAEAIAVLADLGVSAAGANCGTGSAEVERALARMHAAVPALPLIGKPNAGVPHLEHGVAVYPETPADLAAAAGRMSAAGAAVVGVCCGGSPAHVRAIAAAMGQRGR